jgi:MFS family permease
MFASIIFLPRFYQAVRGISATKSGYMIWPLLIGLIGGSISSGILVSKIGRYKILLTIATATFVVGSFLMTHMRVGTPDWELWIWMFIMGIGIGPSMSVFTVVVQSNAPPQQMGVATSTLVFLRQIGATVGLAIAGELFSQQFAQKLPEQLSAHGLPAQVIQHAIANAGGSATGSLTGVGLRAHLLHTLPPQLQPLIPRIVAGVYDAFSLAIGEVFWLSVIAGLIAFAATLILPDQPLRGQAAVVPGTAGRIPGAQRPAAGEAAAH